MKMRESERETKYITFKSDDYFSPMPHWEKLEILALLDSISLDIILASLHIILAQA